ncbi:hypothetical protein SCHPADRAFT_795914, partial [Schizopora paradoxa]
RPSEVARWTRTQRPCAVPVPITDVKVFGEAWRLWYTGLMPVWRLDGVDEVARWPLKRGVPPGEEWAGLVKGGRDGMSLLLVSLSWW